MTRARGFAPWNPQAATWALLGDVQAVLETYRDHLPLTVRQVFYRLVATTGYDKTEQAYARLCEHLVRARRAGIIPFHVLRDDGVNSTGGGGYTDAAQFVRTLKYSAEHYERDVQVGQDVYVELWCEAEGMMPQLERATRDYCVPVYSAGGFLSVTATYEIAERALGRDVPTVLLHIGDYDPSGESIFVALADDVRAFIDDRGGLSPITKRIALTEAQVEAWNLPTAPPKKTDSRSANWAGSATCQCESLPPDLLAEIASGAVEHMLDLGLVDEIREVADGERAEFIRMIESL